MKNRRKIEMTAIHEAGHAVMCFDFQIKFNYVSIIPNEDYLGVVKHPKGLFGKNFNPEWDISPATQDRIERHARTYFAGQIAERIFFGKISESQRKFWGGDTHQAVDYAAYVAGGGKVLEKYIDYLYASAEAWFNNPAHRYAVRVLADELLLRKKIGSKKAREIIKKAFNDCFENQKNQNEAFLEKWKWLEN